MTRAQYAGIMSLDSLGSLGSLAHSMSDKFLRENFRRIVTGTGMSVASIVEGDTLLTPKAGLNERCGQSYYRQVNA